MSTRRDFIKLLAAAAASTQLPAVSVLSAPAPALATNVLHVMRDGIWTPIGRIESFEIHQEGMEHFTRGRQSYQTLVGPPAIDMELSAVEVEDVPWIDGQDNKFTVLLENECRFEFDASLSDVSLTFDEDHGRASITMQIGEVTR